MSLCPERIDGDIDREPLDESHHVVYLVKRPAYTLVLAVPKTLPLPRGAALASCRIRATDRRQTGHMALGLTELSDFCKDLHQLMEYWLQECEKGGGPLRPHEEKGHHLP
jgi:hypothetical protein